MENIVLIFTIIGIHIFAWLTPGPNIILIIRNSLVYSRKAGVWTALGMALSNVVHITLVVLGLSVVLFKIPIVFNIIKYAGIIYLLYLGIKTFLIKIQNNKVDEVNENKYISPFNAIKIGFITNILSPKAPPFFASIFAMVMSSGSPFWVVIALWIIMPLDTFFMASLHSIIFSHKKINGFYKKYQHIVNKVLGLLLISLALIIIFYKP